jgi:OOP family OmpA-OmpF porin
MVSLALAGIAQTAAAQDAVARPGVPTTSWYIGGGFGQTWAIIPDQTVDFINSDLSAANGATFSVLDKDKHAAEVKFFAGYTFNPYFSVEGGFAYLGDSKVSMDFRNGLNSVGTFNLQYKMNAIFIDAVGSLPVGDNWSFIGRIGVSYNTVDANFNGQPITYVASSNDTTETKIREKFGAGIDYKLNPQFTARLEWERYKMPDPLSDEQFNADTATLSLLYRF